MLKILAQGSNQFSGIGPFYGVIEPEDPKDIIIDNLRNLTPDNIWFWIYDHLVITIAILVAFFLGLLLIISRKIKNNK